MYLLLGLNFHPKRKQKTKNQKPKIRIEVGKKPKNCLFRLVKFRNILIKKKKRKEKNKKRKDLLAIVAISWSGVALENRELVALENENLNWRAENLLHLQVVSTWRHEWRTETRERPTALLWEGDRSLLADNGGKSWTVDVDSARDSSLWVTHY